MTSTKKKRHTKRASTLLTIFCTKLSGFFFFSRLYLGYRDYDRYRKYVQKIKNNEVLYTEGSIQLDDSD